MLYRILAEHLQTFVERIHTGELRWPGFVSDELSSFLDCGILARGFARVHCTQCGMDALVTFSCKGRGFCPSCGGELMKRVFEHWSVSTAAAAGGCSRS